MVCAVLRHMLQICSNGGTTAASSGLARCEAVLHSCGTSPVGGGEGGVCLFMSLQQLGSHQDGYQHVTVHTHGDFILLPHWDTRATRLGHQGHQTVISMTCYPTQSHYPETESTSPSHILIMLRTMLGSNKYLKSLV